MPHPKPRPLISVIIPVFDVGDHVADCLRSLQAQTLGDFEALVIDDGSTDNSAAIAEKVIGQDPRFQLIKQQNQGLSGARNTGLDLAQGDFIAFLDSDDRLDPSYLSWLWQALDTTGADWVSCGIRFCFPNDHHIDHSAIHGRAERHSSGQITRYPQHSWKDAIPHFPSAWNKLYRRSLIDGLRFPEGTWFEDHEFYYQAVARTDHLLHIEAPLYLQTRQRQGQITGRDSDRVFEQFTVLDRVKQLMVSSDRPDAEQAFERITSRLLFERSTALRAPERRARYASACATYLATHQLTYAPDWDPHISRAWGLEMAGTLPLSVVIPWAGQDIDLLEESLQSLARQGAPGREILILCSSDQALAQAKTIAEKHPEARVLHHTGGEDLGAACNAGLQAAQGLYVNFLVAGDTLTEMALHDWVDGLLKSRADFAVSVFRLGLEGDNYHSSFYQNDTVSLDDMGAAAFRFSPEAAIALDGQVSPKLYRRAFLTETGLQFGPGALPGWTIAMQASLMAQKAAYFQQSGCNVNQSSEARAQHHPPHHKGTGFRQDLRSLDQLAEDLDPNLAARLSKGWQRRLFARALRQRIARLKPPLRQLKLALLSASAAWIAFRRGLTREQTPLDPGEGRRIATLLSIEARLRRDS
ncbi:glycosyltransferase family 2 protein [Pseudophaeobacter sp.]|uniref:glycosyltransferase family 2 protein n=1 Tax=Pseudophaeobacter sp. TaxID=1971739 RepID=UPI002613D1D6|nr:glycosyltransferase family 2 protein [Pseudophaeobacter sp.]